MEELDRGRVPTVLATDADLEIWFGRSTSLYTHADERTDTLSIDLDERVSIQDVLLQVRGKEAARVVAREAEGRLSQVVRPEREEIRLLCDTIRHDTCSRKLDHRPDGVADTGVALLDHGLRSKDDLLAQSPKLRLRPDERDHDFGHHVDAFGL